MPGTLYIVATPIGNLADMTYRAVEVLRAVDTIACEDTRQTRKLLDHYGIAGRLLSYHEHNETERTPQLLAQLEGGASVAVVTDAGTPLVADPGYRLVVAATAAGVSVVPVPGASAPLAALAASGLPVHDFRFGGFLPRKQNARRELLARLGQDSATLIFFEAPHRLLESLADVAAVLGDPPVVLAREVTKLHEEFLRGRCSEVLARLRRRPALKGECTLLIGKGESPPEPAGSPADEVLRLEQQGLTRMDAIKQVARRRGLSKRIVYRSVTGDEPASG
jgi:16S rRNA (cytidine1402-2'-O)-methyltransferase